MPRRWNSPRVFTRSGSFGRGGERGGFRCVSCWLLTARRGARKERRSSGRGIIDTKKNLRSLEESGTDGGPPRWWCRDGCGVNLILKSMIFSLEETCRRQSRLIPYMSGLFCACAQTSFLVVLVSANMRKHERYISEART